MKKIQFKNNSEPYLSAENLNQMQDNIEIAFSTQNVITSGTNLNDYKETGTYFFRNSSVAPTNIPAGSNGWLVVLKGDDTHCKQIWFRLGSEPNHYQTFIRTCLDGAWTTWVSLTFGN